MIIRAGLIDTAAIVNLVAVVMKAIPEATLVLTFIWAVLRVWESKTVQNWLPRKKRNRRREDRNAT